MIDDLLALSIFVALAAALAAAWPDPPNTFSRRPRSRDTNSRPGANRP